MLKDLLETYKYMTSISEKVYIDKLDDIVNKYNNIYHKTIKIKSVDVKPSAYIDSSKDINYQDPKFKIGHIVRISKYKYSFAKGYVPNWSEEVFLKKKDEKNVPWTYFFSDLNPISTGGRYNVPQGNIFVENS